MCLCLKGLPYFFGRGEIMLRDVRRRRVARRGKADRCAIPPCCRVASDIWKRGLVYDHPSW
jgi:hypothetical protein